MFIKTGQQQKDEMKQRLDNLRKEVEAANLEINKKFDDLEYELVLFKSISFEGFKGLKTVFFCLK